MDENTHSAHTTTRRSAEATALDPSPSRADALTARCTRDVTRSILQAAPAVILIAHDPDCRRMTRNRAACELMQSPLDATGRSPPGPGRNHRVSRADGELTSLESLMREAARGIEEQGVELSVPAEDGSARHLRGNVAQVLDEQDLPRGAIAVFVDVTELKQALEFTSTQTRELARSNLELEQFSATVSHDLRSPLMSLAGCVEILHEEHLACLPPEAQELLDYVRQSASHMSRLITRMLEYTQAKHGELQVTQCDANSAFGSAVERLQAAMHSAGGSVTCDTLPTLLADELLLSVVFQNLLENAIKYCGEAPPRIHLSAIQEPGRWIFSVRDHGIGVNPGDFDRIFRAFERSPAHGPGSGLGIGLSTCRRIVERHGGNIWIESQPGCGATFFFSVPR